MKEHEIEIIKKAYKRCYGLQENCKYFDSPNKAFKDNAFNTLSQQTGLRLDFIKKHQNEIKDL